MVSNCRNAMVPLVSVSSAWSTRRPISSPATGLPATRCDSISLRVRFRALVTRLSAAWGSAGARSGSGLPAAWGSAGSRSGSGLPAAWGNAEASSESGLSAAWGSAGAISGPPQMKSLEELDRISPLVDLDEGPARIAFVVGAGADQAVVVVLLEQVR